MIIFVCQWLESILWSYLLFLNNCFKIQISKLTMTSCLQLTKQHIAVGYRQNIGCWFLAALFCYQAYHFLSLAHQLFETSFALETSTNNTVGGRFRESSLIKSAVHWLWRVNNAEPVSYYDLGIRKSPLSIKGPISSTYLQKENIVVSVLLEFPQ